MNTKTLINNAVLNSSTAGRKGLADRLFATWFNRLVYAQIWEDPALDLDALELKPGAHLLTISSGGCNALAYLSQSPGAVHVVDLNSTHLAMLDIKRAALAKLPSYEEVLAFLGDANQPDNQARYADPIASALAKDSRDYWETTDWRGRPRHSCFSRHAYRHGLLGEFIGFSHFAVRLLGGNLAKVAEAKNMAEQKQLFEQHVAPVFEHWLIRFLCRQPMMLYSLGIPPSQFDVLQADAKAQGISMAQLFKERLRHLACDFPLNENCFAGQAFARRYDTTQNSALPMYLQREHYETIRANLGNLYPHHASLTDVLRQQPLESLDAYLFLDAQDWMDKAQLTDLWWEVTRTAAAGARVVFRTGGSESPLEKMLPPDLLSAWHTDPAWNRHLHARDRSAIYGGTHLYIRN
jgi:S-adenosylmethionine-diacylglycerol 3-amino-3-carboxypropyl transferase